MPERGTSRRGFAPTLLVGVGGAVLAAVAGAKDWAHASGSSAGVPLTALTRGSESAPLVTALSLVALAAWGVLLVTRGRVRQVVAVVGALASLGALVATVVAFGTAKDDALRALDVKGAVGGSAQASLTGWYFVAAAGSLAALAGFAVAVRLAVRWPAMGTKYDAPGARAEQPVTEQDMWRALDEGHDPTS